MTDFNGLLGKFLNGGVGTNLASGMAGGLAGSMLMTKTGRKIGKNALKFGGVAAVGALAYAAYKRFNNGQPTAATESNVELENAGYIPHQGDSDRTQTLGLVLIRAMIAASRADGRLDAQESRIIYEQIQSLDLDEEQKHILVAEMSNPVDVDSIVNFASSQEIASEIYAVSVLAIGDQNEAEKAYLSMLAARLALPGDLQNAIEDEVNQQRVLN